MRDSFSNNVLVDPVISWSDLSGREHATGLAPLISAVSRGDMKDITVPHLARNGVWHVLAYLFSIIAHQTGNVRGLSDREVVNALYRQVQEEHPFLDPVHPFRVCAPVDQPAFLQTVIPKEAIEKGNWDKPQKLDLIPDPTANFRPPELSQPLGRVVVLLMAYQTRPWSRGGNQTPYPGESTAHVSIVPGGSLSERMILEVECLLKTTREQRSSDPMLGWILPWPTGMEGNPVHPLGLGVSDPVRLFRNPEGTFRAGRMTPSSQAKFHFLVQPACFAKSEKLKRPPCWRSTPWAFTQTDAAGNTFVWNPARKDLQFSQISSLLELIASQSRSIGKNNNQSVQRPPLVTRSPVALEEGSYLLVSGTAGGPNSIDSVIDIKIPLPSTGSSGQTYWNRLSRTVEDMASIAKKEGDILRKKLDQYLLYEQFFASSSEVLDGGKIPSKTRMKEALGKDDTKGKRKLISSIRDKALHNFDQSVHHLFFSFLGRRVSHENLTKWRQDVKEIARQYENEVMSSPTSAAAAAFAKAVGLKQGAKYVSENDSEQLALVDCIQEATQSTLELPSGDIAEIRRGDLVGSHFAVLHKAIKKAPQRAVSFDFLRHTTRLVALVGETSEAHPAAALSEAHFHPRRFELLISSEGQDLLDNLERACMFLRSNGRGVDPAPIYFLIRENFRMNNFDRVKVNWMRQFFC